MLYNSQLDEFLVLAVLTPFVSSGERNYGPAVDMWGAGCIMAEMWTRSPIMQVARLGTEGCYFKFCHS